MTTSTASSIHPCCCCIGCCVCPAAAVPPPAPWPPLLKAWSPRQCVLTAVLQRAAGAVGQLLGAQHLGVEKAGRRQQQDSEELGPIS